MAGIRTFEVQIGQRQAECTHWLSKGYGLAPALVLRDPTLPLGAKAVYSYLMTFTSAERRDAWPSRQRMIRELGVNKDTLAKYMAMLVQRGLVFIEQSRRKGSRYGHNIYRIAEWICCRCGDGKHHRAHAKDQRKPCPKNPDTESSDTVNPVTNKTKYLTGPKKDQYHRRTDQRPSPSVHGSLCIETSPRRSAQHMRPAFDAYRRLIGAPGPAQRRRLSFWVDEAGLAPELVAFGIETAVAQKKANGEPPPRMAYIEGVLRNWRNDGYTTQAQAMAHEARLAAAKTVRQRFYRGAEA